MPKPNGIKKLMRKLFLQLAQPMESTHVKMTLDKRLKDWIESDWVL